MSILQQLSSVVGDKTEASNRKVTEKCLQDRNLIQEIGAGIMSDKPALVGDCAEVLTKVAEQEPSWVSPFYPQLVPLLNSKKTRVRWEAMHAIALMAELLPEEISTLLPKLRQCIQSDKSTIVRDYAIETISAYAKTSHTAALASFPILKETLYVWEGKHRGRALKGMSHVVSQAPECAVEARMIAEDFLHDNRGVVQKAAKALVKVIDQG